MIGLSRRRRHAGDVADTHGDSLPEESSPDPLDDAAVPEADVAAHPEISGARWKRVVAYGMLPVLALLTAGGAGYLKWLQASARETQSARIESVQAATEGTIKILSYSPESVDRDLDAARDKLTGSFRDAYTRLAHEVVIPGSKEKKISATATVPGATSISASPSHAVVMVFVNQSLAVANDPPSSTASTVRVTMDKHDDRWLISDFTPI
jgi:Mce-associated membrane protein